MIRIGPDATPKNLTPAMNLALVIIDQVVTAHGGSTAPVVLESVSRNCDWFVFQTMLFREDINFLDPLRAYLGEGLELFEVQAISKGRYRVRVC